MISVIIPAYNAAKFIRQTIDSVLSQTYKDFELIVIDDGSTDNTGEVVKSYGDKVRYIYQQNAGDGPARNTGIKAARGEWIAFLDHDDQWLQNKLESQMALLTAHPDLNWCATAYYLSNGHDSSQVGTDTRVTALLGDKEYFENYFYAAGVGGVKLIWMSSLLINRKVFDELGVFDSCWLRHADLDMWWRIAHRYAKIGFICEPLVTMRLEFQTGINTVLVLKDKRGCDARKLVSKHLELTKSFGDSVPFQFLASHFLFGILRTTLFHGFKEDAREIISRFKQLFNWKLRYTVYVLTIFPQLTSLMLRSISQIKHILGLQSEVTRRFRHKDVVKAQSA